MNPASDVSRFTSVDSQPDPDFYVDFVDMANQLPGIDEVEAVAVAALRLIPGGRVLDLGCGTGNDTRRLAAIVGPDGEAVGIDASAAMIAAAVERTEGTGLPATFRVADAAVIDFPDGSFDAVRCERLLIHVPDPARVLAEMVRVTRPGGRVAVIDVDFDIFALDLPDVTLTRRVLHAMTDAMASGQIGRQLPRLCREAGLVDVTVESRLVSFTPQFIPMIIPGSLAAAVATGGITADDADAFWHSVEVAQKDGELFCAFPFFLVSGTKP